MNVLVDFTQIPIQKVGVGVYAKETFRIPNKDVNELFFLLQDDDNDLRNAFLGSKIILVKSKFFRIFFFRFLLEQFYIPFLCCKYRINILHSLHYSFPIFLFKVKRIVTIHDLTFFIHPDVHTFIKRYYFRLFIKLACKYADRLICVSGSTKRDLERICTKISASIDVVPLSCSPKIQVEEQELELVKRKFGVGSHYMLFIGTLEPRKNILNLINGFYEFNRKNKGYNLVIVGKKGWFYESIFKLVEKLNLEGNVIFTGFVTTKEKFILLSGAHSFIYPSIYEGFGLPVLEAITYGVPTITSKLSSLPEVAGNAALYIDPYNVQNIAEIIETVNCDEEIRRRLILNSEKQKLKYSWEKTAYLTYSVYNRYGNI